MNRNTLLTAGYANWDASLTKNFRVREGQNLQFRWESFNASNHPNWGIPNTNVLSAAVFGRVSDGRTMRQMQFGLKYMF